MVGHEPLKLAIQVRILVLEQRERKRRNSLRRVQIRMSERCRAAQGGERGREAVANPRRRKPTRGEAESWSSNDLNCRPHRAGFSFFSNFSIIKVPTMTETQYKFNGQFFNIDLRGESDISVAAEIFKHREYRRAEDAIRNAKHPVVDVGAHIGLFGVYCRALNPNIRIIAVEPDPDNLIVLRKNLQTNGISGVEIIAGGICGATGRRKLSVSDDHLNNFILPIGSKEKDLPVVDVYSFRDFCAANQVKKISLLKLDIEGGEYELLKSLRAEDFKILEALIFEYHNAGDKTYRSMELLLRENGFGVNVYPSKFDKSMGFIYANNKRNK